MSGGSGFENPRGIVADAAGGAVVAGGRATCRIDSVTSNEVLIPATGRAVCLGDCAVRAAVPQND